MTNVTEGVAASEKDVPSESVSDVTPTVEGVAPDSPPVVENADPVKGGANTFKKMIGGAPFPGNIVEPFFLPEEKKEGTVPTPDITDPTPADIESMKAAENGPPKGGKRTKRNKRRKPKTKKKKLYL